MAGQLIYITDICSIRSRIVTTQGSSYKAKINIFVKIILQKSLLFNAETPISGDNFMEIENFTSWLIKLYVCKRGCIMYIWHIIAMESLKSQFN